jgi:chaperonin GroES
MADELKKTVDMLGTYILVRREKPVEQKTPGGIIKPQTAQAADHMTWGTVVAVGPDVAGHPKVGRSLVPGARILVGRYAGSDVRIHGEDAVVVRLEDVIGVECDAG